MFSAESLPEPLGDKVFAIVRERVIRSALRLRFIGYEEKRFGRGQPVSKDRMDMAWETEWAKGALP